MAQVMEMMTGAKARKEARRQAELSKEQARVAQARQEQSTQNQEADTAVSMTATKKAPRGKRLLLGDMSSTLGG